MELSMTFEGLSPLVVHNVQLANPLNEHARAMKRITAKRTKSDEDYAELMRIEWEGGLYWAPDIGPYLPTSYPFAALRGSAKITREGMAIERAVVVMAPDGGERLPIEYDGPRDLEPMWAEEAHRDVRAVRVGAARAIRTRPRFEQWAIRFLVVLDEQILNPDAFREIAHRAGRNVGIGEKPLGTRARFGVTVEERSEVTA